VELFIWIFRVLAGLLIIITLIPLIRNDHWTFRVFEFPRLQKWVINLLLFGISLAMLFPFSFWWDWLIAGTLFLNIAYLSFQIFPFLPIAPIQLLREDGTEKDNLSILVGNVYQYNREASKLVNHVKKFKPDLIILLETDNWWKQQCTQGFGDDYKEQVLEDKENTYGMLLFSNIPLSDTETRYIIKDDIPSIRTKLTMDSGKKVQLYAIHPEPPVPSENPKSTARDAEILKVGQEARENTLPVIVAGDLNDVAWSYTTELFVSTSGLLDPRRGRGFFNTFHAKYPLMRWPLDHIFCSGHFRLKKIKRLPHIGSDHFPMFIHLSLANIDHDENALEADEEDFEQAEEKIKAAL
jgi:endonuclease/exonuclease/phosphatase (EEP) superfamily protein YafD